MPAGIDLALGLGREAFLNSAKEGEEVERAVGRGDCVTGLVSRLETNSSALIRLDMPEETLTFLAISPDDSCGLARSMEDAENDRL